MHSSGSGALSLAPAGLPWQVASYDLQAGSGLLDMEASVIGGGACLQTLKALPLRALFSVWWYSGYPRGWLGAAGRA